MPQIGQRNMVMLTCRTHLQMRTLTHDTHSTAQSCLWIFQIEPVSVMKIAIRIQSHIQNELCHVCAPMCHAHLQMKTHGTPSTAAKLSAACASPSLDAPSPKNTTETVAARASCRVVGELTVCVRVTVCVYMRECVCAFPSLETLLTKRIRKLWGRVRCSGRGTMCVCVGGGRMCVYVCVCVSLTQSPFKNTTETAGAAGCGAGPACLPICQYSTLIAQ